MAPDDRVESEKREDSLPPRLTLPSKKTRKLLDERFLEEPEPSVRTEAQRDRDRILYSSAFLRLGQVTQVASPEVGYTFHSRLTHSMKVAQVARGLAQRLKELHADAKLEPIAGQLVDILDEDATEAAALAHDLGHPPFGHLAEKVLHERSSKGSASFEGNPQSFRIVTRLALRSVEIPGLNLTRRTLNGLAKYPWLRSEEPPERLEKWAAYGGDREHFEWARKGYPEGQKTLEALLMDWADDVTYAVHDMDDFYRAGLIPLDRLTVPGSQELRALKKHLSDKYRLNHPERQFRKDGQRLADVAEELFQRGFVSSIRTKFVGRAEERINLRSVGSALIGLYIGAIQLRDTAEKDQAEFIIPQAIIDEVAVLKELTWFYVINRPSLAVIQRGQRRIINTLYDMYSEAVADEKLHFFPPAFAERIPSAKGDAAHERIVIDLIAGMTEASATEIYRQDIGASTGSLLLGAAGPP